MKRTMVVVAVAVLALTACGSGDPLKGGGGENTGPVIVGSADFSENKLLAQLYAGALKDAGVEVKVQPAVGARDVVVKALQDKSLTVVPEYSGNLLDFSAKQRNETNTATRSDDVYFALKQKVLDGLEVLDKSNAEDSDVLVVSKQTADSGIKSIADLGPRCGDYVLGAAGEWKDRWVDRIRQLYGCTFKEIRTTDAGGPITVDALKNNQVQVANLFTTSSDIQASGFIELADPKQMYPAQNIVPLARKGALNDKAKEALNRVSAKLTTATLAALVKKVDVDKVTAADAAQEFLRSNGL